MPVPNDAPAAPREHFKLGIPAETWTYRDASGALLGHVHRYNLPDGTKAFYPLTWCQHSHHGRTQWRWKSWPAPRPLFGLDRLAARLEAPVLVVEGEKCVDAAAQLLPDYIATTSPNGSNAAGKADWTPLTQRPVTIWRDADASGEKFAGDVARTLAALGVVEVKVVTPPEGVGRGWDIADAAAQNWTPAQVLALVETARPAAQALHGAHSSTERTPADRHREEDKDQGREQGSDGRRGRRPPPQRNQLVKLVEDFDLWHSPEREGFATVEVEGHAENWPLRSRDFRYWLAGRYYDENGGAPGGQALADALGVLEQMAIRGPEYTPHLRVAGADGKVYLD
ncbi:MAG: ATP-binding protein, partial [Proteobacteria bacterium]|nr:ATP-binding protein [Pseudomonadota bacterium]